MFIQREWVRRVGRGWGCSRVGALRVSERREPLEGEQHLLGFYFSPFVLLRWGLVRQA